MSVLPWSPERLAQLRDTVTGGIRARGRTEWHLWGKELGVSAASAQQAYHRAAQAYGWLTVAVLLEEYRERHVAVATTAPAVTPVPVPVDPVQAAQERKARLAELRSERELIEAVAGEKSFRATLESLIRSTITKLPPIDPPVRVTPGKDTAVEDVVQQLSDWHGGEEVTFARTRGFNEFNTEVLAQRIRNIVRSHISIKQRMERGGGWQFETLHLGVNGDLVSGTIHEIERHSDTKNVIMAVYAVGMLLAQAIRDLAAEYPTVQVYCTSGNHGRLPDARRVQQKDPTRSWDTMIALLAKEYLRDTKHIHFNIPDSYSVAFDAQGWTFLQTHGHDVQSWNSIPWYGLGRLVTNLNALEASRRETIHYWLFGHFHSASSLAHASGESFINGSLIGGTEFSINALGKADVPVQWMLMVHREHGVTSRWPLMGAGPSDAPGYTIPAMALKE